MYGINLVFFLPTGEADGKRDECEAFATRQTAWHIINWTKQQSFLTWSLYFCVYGLCAVFLGRHDSSEQTTFSFVGELFLLISEILSLSIFEVDSILDFVQIEISSIRDFVHSAFCPSGILSIRDFVKSGYFSFGIFSIWNFVYSGFCT